MVRCPRDYCCQKFPCHGVDVCAENREGLLCGRCKSGFAEALVSVKCVPNSSCINSRVFYCLYTGWIALVSLFLLFARDMKAAWSKAQEKILLVCKQSRKGKFPSVTSNESVAVVDEESDSSLKKLQILLYYIQDASILVVNIPSQELDEDTLRNHLFSLSEMSIDLVQFYKNTCVLASMTPIQKLLIKSLLGSAILVFYAVLYCGLKFLHWLTRRQCFKHLAYTHLTTSTIFVLLLFYQKFAIASMTLLQCVKIGSQSVIFIDGTVSCYQKWQIGVFIFLCTWVIPVLIVLLVGPCLLARHKVSVSSFFLACLFPIPLLCWWTFKVRNTNDPGNVTKGTEWHTELVQSLQKSFKDIRLPILGPIAWIGIIKLRRLALVMIYTFISDLILRLALMTVFVVLFILVHC